MIIQKTLFLPLFVLIIHLSPWFNEKGESIQSYSREASVKKSDTAYLNQLAELALKYTADKKTLKEAIPLVAEAFKLAQEKKLAVPYQVYWADAEILNENKNFESAFSVMEKACAILKKTDKYSEYAKANNFRASLLLWIGKFRDAIEAYQSNIQFIRKKNLKSCLPAAYRGLADVYLAAGKPYEEKKYTEMMLQASLAENDSEFIAGSYFRLGEITMRTDSNLTLSNKYYKESMRIRERKGDTLQFPSLLNRISWNYYLLKQLDTALTYYNLMAELSLRQKSFKFAANALANIGTIYRDKKEYNKALYYYGKSTAYSMIVKDWYNLSWMNMDMSDMYTQMGDYKKAYECYVAYKNYSDSLKDQKYTTSLADARMRYETETKAKELELANLKLDKQRYFTFAMGGGIIVVIVIGALLFRQSRTNAKRRISEMNQKISEITQANLRQQMNPHFIFNTLNSIQYYMYQHDKIATNNYLTKFSSLMRKTLENSQHTAVTIKDELDALQLYLELETLRFKDKFEYSIQVDDEIDALLFKIPTMLIQPYVENAICHGLINKEEKGFLNIDLKLMSDHILCTIEDNGIGREAAMEIKKSKENNHNSLGTRITESRLQLVNALYGTSMKIHYTDLKDELGNPCGTRVEIQIPIMT